MNDNIWCAARHEIMRAQRSRTLRVSLLLVTLLLAAGFVLEAQRQAADARQQHALQALVSEQWKRQPDRHPHRMAHYGSFAFRSPGALAFFDPGITPFTGNALYLEAHKRNFPSFRARPERLDCAGVWAARRVSIQPASAFARPRAAVARERAE